MKKFNLKKIGGLAALYCGIAYLLMIGYFLVIIDYPSITEQTDKIKMFADNYSGMFITYLLGYALFGIVLAVLSLSLYYRLKSTSPEGSRLIAVFGIMWGVLLTGSGMIFIQGMKTVIELYKINPEQAITVWIAIESSVLGLSFSNGELLGGLWTLLIGIVSLKTKTFNKPMNILAVAVGCAGMLSTVPVINSAGGTGIYGIGQMVWFIWLGILLLKSRNGEANEL
jgi:hypothetical protein